MNETVEITQEELLSLLSEAFDEGSSSFSDLKAGFLEKIVQDFFSTKPKPAYLSPYTITSSGGIFGIGPRFTIGDSGGSLDLRAAAGVNDVVVFGGGSAVSD